MEVSMCPRTVYFPHNHVTKNTTTTNHGSRVHTENNGNTYGAPKGKSGYTVLQFQDVMSEEPTKERKRSPNAKRRQKGGRFES